MKDFGLVSQTTVPTKWQIVFDTLKLCETLYFKVYKVHWELQAPGLIYRALELALCVWNKYKRS